MVAFLVFLLWVFLCLFVFEPPQRKSNSVPLPVMTRTTEKKKTILLYDKLQGDYKFWRVWYEFRDSLVCTGAPWNVTYNCDVYVGSTSTLNTADLVLFSWMDWDRSQSSPMPVKRDGQIWALLTQESPMLRANLNLPIDWVFTYESDADVTLEYGSVSKTDEPQPVQLPSGREFGAALISKCNAASKRQELISELKKHDFTIHVYGKCGSRQLPGTSTEAYKELSEKYKFFMAFENSICMDYATEKFFSALLFPWIPVVLGGANYSSLAPPKSFINVMDFPSVQSLAEYLKYLDRNETAYREYFEWKSDHVVRFETDFGCRVCKHLHRTGWSKGKPPLDLKKFSKEKRCFLPKSPNELFSWNHFAMEPT